MTPDDGSGPRPKARAEALVVEALRDELLIYDLDLDRAHASTSPPRSCSATATECPLLLRLRRLSRTRPAPRRLSLLASAVIRFGAELTVPRTLERAASPCKQ